MKIVSDFVDYYDKIDGNKKSPVFHRKTEIIKDNVTTLYRHALLQLKIETNPKYCSGDVWMTGYTSNQSSVDYIRVIPVLFGIAGELYYYVEYINSVLGVNKKCYDYSDIEPHFKNKKIQRSFDLYYKGFLKGYCRKQFGCVNFIMRNDGNFELIKEPCLSDYIDSGIFSLTAEEIYDGIEYFIKETKELDMLYDLTKPTRYEYEKMTTYKRRAIAQYNRRLEKYQ